MGHREPLKSGDEHDALTRARRFYGPTAGVVQAIKRKFWRRVRKDAKRELEKDLRD